MNSRLGPRTTREERASREPIARSEWPESSGATSGSNAERSVERSTSMYATTSASEPSHTCLSARPRPLADRCTARTPGRRRTSSSAIAPVRSVLALSAMVTRAGNGTRSSRKRRSVRTVCSRATSSL